MKRYSMATRSTYWFIAKEQELIQHHDYYIFGHRHLKLDLEVANDSRYLNPGDWVNNSYYIVFDGTTCELLEFQD